MEEKDRLIVQGGKVTERGTLRAFDEGFAKLLIKAYEESQKALIKAYNKAQQEVKESVVNDNNKV